MASNNWKPSITCNIALANLARFAYLCFVFLCICVLANSASFAVNLKTTNLAVLVIVGIFQVLTKDPGCTGPKIRIPEHTADPGCQPSKTTPSMIWPFYPFLPFVYSPKKINAQKLVSMFNCVEFQITEKQE